MLVMIDGAGWGNRTEGSFCALPGVLRDRVAFTGSLSLPGPWLVCVPDPGDVPPVSCQAGDQLGGAVDLVFGVVVVRGQPDKGVDAAVLGVQRVILGHRGGDVHTGPAQRRGGLLRRQTVDLGGDDGTADQAEVVDGDAGQLGELAAEPGAQRPGALPDLLQA